MSYSGATKPSPVNSRSEKSARNPPTSLPFIFWMRIAPTPARIASTFQHWECPYYWRQGAFSGNLFRRTRSEVPHYNVALVEKRSKFGREKKGWRRSHCVDQHVEWITTCWAKRTTTPKRNLPTLCRTRLKMFLGSNTSRRNQYRIGFFFFSLGDRPTSQW